MPAEHSADLGSTLADLCAGPGSTLADLCSDRNTIADYPAAAAYVDLD